jgi:hypothetical protein
MNGRRPRDLPPGGTVYQQTKRRIEAKVLEAFVHDLRRLLREADQEHGITLEVVQLDEAKKGFVRLPRRWVVERSFA